MRTGRWFRRAAAGAVISLVAGCGGGQAVQLERGDGPAPSMRWNAVLSTPGNLTGVAQVRGQGWMASAEDAGRTLAAIRIENATPGGRHPWHVHRGRCGMDQGILGEPSSYELLEVGGDGRAEEEATVDLQLPTSGEYMINVHASPENMSTVIACGNLAQPIR